MTTHPAWTARPIGSRPRDIVCHIVGAEPTGQVPHSTAGQEPYDGAGPAHDPGDRGLLQTYNMVEEDRVGLGARQVGDQGLGRLGGQRGSGQCVGDLVPGRRRPGAFCRVGRCAATSQVAARVPPGEARRPASESVPVATKPWQLPGDLPPGSGGDILGALTHGPAQVAEQARLDQSVQHRERGLVTVLRPGDRRAQRQIVGRHALSVPTRARRTAPVRPQEGGLRGPTWSSVVKSPAAAICGDRRRPVRCQARLSRAAIPWPISRYMRAGRP